MFIAIGIFFVFLLLGMPVAFSIGLSGFSFFMIRDLPMTDGECHGHTQQEIS